jgi:hypothetical protein
MKRNALAVVVVALVVSAASAQIPFGPMATRTGGSTRPSARPRGPGWLPTLAPAAAFSVVVVDSGRSAAVAGRRPQPADR